MSAHATNGFLPVLREVGRSLTLPLPARTRFLRELSGDLEELVARLVDEGLSPEDARARALDALVPDTRTLAALEGVHATAYRRLTRHLTPARLRRIERGTLTAATSALLVGATWALVRADLLRHASPFLFAVLGLGGVLFAAVAAKGFQLWIARDHRAPRRGLGAILGVSAATLLTGLGGAFVDFYRLTALLSERPALAETLVPAWLVRDAALLSVALLLAVAGGLAWFVFNQWVAVVEGDHHDVLGLPSTHHLRRRNHS